MKKIFLVFTVGFLVSCNQAEEMPTEMEQVSSTQQSSLFDVSPEPLPNIRDILKKGVHQTRGDFQNTGQSKYTGPQVGNLKWKHNLGKEGCGYEVIATSPILDDFNNLYFGTSDGRVISMTPNQKVIWEHKIPDAYDRYHCLDYGSADPEDYYVEGSMYDLNINQAPAIVGNYLIFGTSGIGNNKKVYVLDSKTGQKLWDIDLDDKLSSNIKVGPNKTVYFTTRKTLYSLNLFTKEIKQNSNLSIEFGLPAISSDGSIYMCLQRGFVVAFDKNLNMKWRNYIGGKNRYCFPAIDEVRGAVYFPSSDQSKLFAFDLNGRSKFTTTIDWSESSPAIAKDGTIYIGASNTSKAGGACDASPKLGSGVVYAIKPNGSIDWKFEVPATKTINDDGDHGNKYCYDNNQAVDGAVTIGADGKIYFGTDAQKFYALNPDGSILWSIGGSVEFDRIGAISSDGTLYFAPAGAAQGGLFAVYDGIANEERDNEDDSDAKEYEDEILENDNAVDMYQDQEEATNYNAELEAQERAILEEDKLKDQEEASNYNAELEAQERAILEEDKLKDQEEATSYNAELEAQERAMLEEDKLKDQEEATSYNAELEAQERAMLEKDKLKDQEEANNYNAELETQERSFLESDKVTDEDERVLREDEDERVLREDEDERVLREDEDERVLREDEKERLFGDDEDDMYSICLYIDEFDRGC